jgi:hypothetical protein
MEGLIILVVLALAAIQVILPIFSLVIASRTRARLQALEEATARLRDELGRLREGSLIEVRYTVGPRPGFVCTRA